MSTGNHSILAHLLRLGVERLAVPGGVERDGEGQADAGKPGGVAVVDGGDHARFGGVDPEPGLLVCFPDESAECVFADLELAGGQVPESVRVYLDRLGWCQACS